MIRLAAQAGLRARPRGIRDPQGPACVDDLGEQAGWTGRAGHSRMTKMSSTMKATFQTRREAELAIERLVQECGLDRKAVEVFAEGDENSAGEVSSGSDLEAGTPSPDDRDDAALAGRIIVSVQVASDDEALAVGSAFRELGGE